MADKLVKTISDFKNSLNGQTISIHGKDYATVAHRLAIARRNLGIELDITTKIIHLDNEKAVVQADIFLEGKHVSTGLAEEFRSASRINQTSALENAETSAVGRALAFLGIINDQIASAEEVSLAIEQQDKQLQKALTELEVISHLGAYKAWLSTYKPAFEKLKVHNPLSYKRFMEKFTAVKTNLTNKGVNLNNG
jgi:hypothetical protein